MPAQCRIFRPLPSKLGMNYWNAAKRMGNSFLSLEREIAGSRVMKNSFFITLRPLFALRVDNFSGREIGRYLVAPVGRGPGMVRVKKATDGLFQQPVRCAQDIPRDANRCAGCVESQHYYQWSTGTMNIRTMQLVAIASLVALLAGCDGRAKPAESPQAKKIDSNTVIFPKDSSQASALSAEPVVSGQSAVLRLNGRLVWNEDKTVRVYTPFSGRVTKILVQAGDLVRAGQSLAILASPDFGQAQADARRALSDFAMAEKNLRRMKELFDHGVVAEKDFVVAEADYARAESEKQRTTARLNLYGNNGGSVDQLFQLTSPLAGVVVEKNINPGQELRPDQVPANGSGLFVITDPSRLWFQLDVSERDLAHIRRGLNVAIRSPAWPDEVCTGRIISISDCLDPQSRALKVRGTF